jgi:hypothetical protein
MRGAVSTAGHAIFMASNEAEAQEVARLDDRHAVGCGVDTDDGDRPFRLAHGFERFQRHEVVGRQHTIDPRLHRQQLAHVRPLSRR